LIYIRLQEHSHWNEHYIKALD